MPEKQRTLVITPGLMIGGGGVKGAGRHPQVLMIQTFRVLGSLSGSAPLWKFGRQWRLLLPDI